MVLRLRRPIHLGNVRAELTDPSVLRLEGTLTQDVARRGVAEAIAEIHARVVSGELREFTLDVRGLSYANSAAIRVFIDMASRARTSGYRVILEIDASITWHCVNLTVLQAMAPQAVELRNLQHAAVAE
jgi:anti-anti-sigma regulatory factor